MKIILCDDDLRELDKTQALLTEYAELKKSNIKTVCFSSAYELLETVYTADIYILDIIMPELTGIELGKKIKEKNKNALIIYTTTSKDFAIDSYSVKAFSYLLKPLDKDRLFSELDDCISRIKKPERKIAIQLSNGQTTLSVKKIVFVEYQNHRLIYHPENKEKLESGSSRDTFDELIKKFLTDTAFLKISTSFVINMEHVRRFTNRSFIMSDGTELAISRKYTEARDKYIDFEIEGGEMNIWN